MRTVAQRNEYMKAQIALHPKPAKYVLENLHEHETALEHTRDKAERLKEAMEEMRKRVESSTEVIVARRDECQDWDDAFEDEVWNTATLKHVRRLEAQWKTYGEADGAKRRFKCVLRQRLRVAEHRRLLINKIDAACRALLAGTTT